MGPKLPSGSTKKEYSAREKSLGATALRYSCHAQGNFVRTFFQRFHGNRQTSHKNRLRCMSCELPCVPLSIAGKKMEKMPHGILIPSYISAAIKHTPCVRIKKEYLKIFLTNISNVSTDQARLLKFHTLLKTLSY